MPISVRVPGIPPKYRGIPISPEYPTGVLPHGRSQGWMGQASEKPQSGNWRRIDEELIEAYRGTMSLPFDWGDYQRGSVRSWMILESIPSK
jgi:hypothetical protein